MKRILLPRSSYGPTGRSLSSSCPAGSWKPAVSIAIRTPALMGILLRTHLRSSPRCQPRQFLSARHIPLPVWPRACTSILCTSLFIWRRGKESCCSCPRILSQAPGWALLCPKVRLLQDLQAAPNYGFWGPDCSVTSQAFPWDPCSPALLPSFDCSVPRLMRHASSWGWLMCWLCFTRKRMERKGYLGSDFAISVQDLLALALWLQSQR